MERILENFGEYSYCERYGNINTDFICSNEFRNKTSVMGIKDDDSPSKGHLFDFFS